MKNYSTWFFTAILLTSVSLSFPAKAAEVLSSTDGLSNTPHIRSLAASCAACHGSNGNSVDTMPTLAGLDAAYLTTQMLAFKDGSRTATVMHHHAKGLNIDEINLLANYFSQQKRVASVVPKTQTLKADHGN